MLTYQQDFIKSVHLTVDIPSIITMQRSVKVGMIFLMLSYTIFFIIATYNLFKYYHRVKVINARVSFHASFIIYYIFIPLISLLTIEIGEYNLTGMLLRISERDIVEYFYAFFFTTVAYGVYVGSYKIKLYKKEMYSISDRGGFYTLEPKDEESNYHAQGRIFIISIIMGVFSLSLGLYAQGLIVDSLGGIINAITMGDKLRAFGVSSSIYIPSSRLFAITLMPITLTAPYLFLYAQRFKKTLGVKILLIVSVLSSFLYFSINAGRIAILVFLSTFIIDFVFRKSKHPFVFLIMSSLILLLSLGMLDDLFFYLSYGFIKDSQTGFLSTLNEFAFPYLNLVNITEINKQFPLRYGVDFITWIVNVIPSKVLAIFGFSKVQTGYNFITEYYLGTNATGGIPTDIITLGIRQYGTLGIFPISFLLARVSKIIDSIIEKTHERKYYFMTLRISSIMFLIIPYGDIDSFIRNRFDMIVILLFIVSVNRMKKNARRKKMLD